MEILLIYFLPLLMGYLLGSIPFGYVVGSLYGVDLTQTGSGSTGATNALRSIGKEGAALVFLGDFGKGIFAPLLAGYLLETWLPSSRACDFGIAQAVCASGVLIGHAKSIWIGFKGGKSVAAGVGTLFALDWRVGLFTGAIWLTVVILSRISSLGAIVAWCLAPLTTYLFRSNLIQGSLCETFLTWVFTGYALAGALYILYKHRANIERLSRGEESKIGQSNK